MWELNFLNYMSPSLKKKHIPQMDIYKLHTYYCPNTNMQA